MIKYILILISFSFINCSTNKVMPNKATCLIKSHMQYNCQFCMEQHEICYVCNHPCENKKNSNL